jgi:hypothetical protein
VLTPLVGVIAILRNQRLRSETRSSTTELVVDAEGVRRTLADGRREEVRWDEVTQVDAFTTRVGPHKASGGAVVLFGDAERGCIVPLDQVSECGLLSHISRLPGFDLQVLIQAVQAGDRRERESLDNPLTYLMPRPLQATTECWRRPDSGRGSGSDEPGQVDEPGEGR